MTSLKLISDEALETQTKNLVHEERKINLEVLHHIKEIEFRRIHLARGYSSLFKYVVCELSYSEDEAYRRISAMRLLRDVPEVEKKIEAGTMSLTNACKIQNYLRAEVKEQGFIAKKEKLELIEALENKSTREVEKELIKLNPRLEITEKIRPIAEDKIELKVILNEDLKQKLDQVKAHLAHKNPQMSYQELIHHMAEIALEKLDLTKKGSQRNVSGARPKQTSQTRFIPAAVKRFVWRRDRGACTYVDAKTKRKCGSNHLLQLDHIKPFALGGESSAENLRLLCSAHNRYR